MISEVLVHVCFLRHAVRHNTIVAAACDKTCLLYSSQEAKETTGPKDKISFY